MALPGALLSPSRRTVPLAGPSPPAPVPFIAPAGNFGRFREPFGTVITRAGANALLLPAAEGPSPCSQRLFNLPFPFSIPPPAKREGWEQGQEEQGQNRAPQSGSNWKSVRGKGERGGLAHEGVRVPGPARDAGLSLRSSRAAGAVRASAKPPVALPRVAPAFQLPAPSCDSDRVGFRP